MIAMSSVHWRRNNVEAQSQQICLRNKLAVETKRLPNKWMTICRFLTGWYYISYFEVGHIFFCFKVWTNSINIHIGPSSSSNMNIIGVYSDKCPQTTYQLWEVTKNEWANIELFFNFSNIFIFLNTANMEMRWYCNYKYHINLNITF